MDGGLGEHGEQLVARPAEVALDLQAERAEPLPPGVGAGALLQQRQGGELLGVQAIERGDQRRTAHRHRVLAHQEAGLGARPVAVAEVQRGVELGVGEQERPGAVGQVDGDLGVPALEVLEARQQPLGGEGRHHRQLEAGAALLAHHRQGVALHRVQLGGDAPAVGQAVLGQHDAATGAAKQLEAEERLEAGDLPAHRALGQRQLLGGLGEALVARRRLEGDQRGGAGDLAAHVRRPHSQPTAIQLAAISE
ncbi:hypothetical protein D3C81_1366980 [compost metagenome]